MDWAFAYAESAGPPDQNVWFVVIGVGAFAAAALLMFVPIALARRRRHRFTEIITTASVFLGFLAAGSVIYFTIQQMNWSHEQTLRLQSGYGNPDDLADAPRRSWVIWALMILIYIALLLWAWIPRRRSDIQRI